MVQVKDCLRPVYIVDGSRTPWLKATGKSGPFTAADLAVAAGNAVLLRQPFLPHNLDELVLGCVMPSMHEANISRIVSLRLGCGHAVTAWTVQRNCASGLQAIDSVAQNIAVGRADLALAGGTEAMSYAPLLYSTAASNWLADWRQAKTAVKKVQLLNKLRANWFSPIIALLGGLKDPLVGLSMGQTAENLAYQFSVERKQMDSFALQSHQRLLAAQQAQHLGEITPIFTAEGQFFTADNGVRSDTSLAKLAQLPALFDPPYGEITAGNSSQITDGAAVLLLASEVSIQRYQLPVLARIQAITWAGIDPALMGLGPVHAISQLLKRTGKTIADIDYWEINEAFAAQVLACVAALNDPAYCQKNLDLSTAHGLIPITKLNVDGGAIACGHPLGASGARIVLHLAHVLQRTGKRWGVASLCIGGGQGGAILIERV